jgi:hypothetical protein
MLPGELAPHQVTAPKSLNRPVGTESRPISPRIGSAGRGVLQEISAGRVADRNGSIAWSPGENEPCFFLDSDTATPPPKPVAGKRRVFLPSRFAVPGACAARNPDFLIAVREVMNRVYHSPFFRGGGAGDSFNGLAGGKLRDRQDSGKNPTHRNRLHDSAFPFHHRRRTRGAS